MPAGSFDLQTVARRLLDPGDLESTTQYCVANECARGIEHYLERVKRLGFVGLEKVLDAGCGIGQWSIALGMLNREVFAVDHNPERIDIANRIKHAAARNNVHFQAHSIDRLPFADASFDGIVCAGVLMFVQPAKALDEFTRVLKPDGILFVQGNGIGWALRSIVLRGLLGREPVAVAAVGGRRSIIRQHLKVLLRSFSSRDLPNVCFTERRVRRMFQERGLGIIGFGGDGKISGADTSGSSGGWLYPRRFGGCWCVFEVVGRKNGSASRGVPLRLQPAGSNTLETRRGMQ